MPKITCPARLLLLAVLTFGLTGCELTRSGGQNNDIDQFTAPVSASPASAPSALQIDATVRLDPATRQLNVGEIGTIQLRLDNAANITEINLQLRFAPEFIQIEDNDTTLEGVQIQLSDELFDRDFVDENQADNAAGVINYYATPVTFSGSGLLATIYFRAVASGISDLNFALAEVATSEEPLTPIPSQSSQVIVNPGAEQPTPTFTLTLAPGQPTETPTFVPGLVTATFTPPPVAAAPTETPTPTMTPLPTATSTPAPPQVEIPAGATVGECYRVQPGDTLYSLAQRFGTDPQFISLANDLYPPGHIYPQKVLFMPTAYGRGPNVYMVREGDTLASIAEGCELEADFLAWVNRLEVDANLADIGTLIIPRPPYAPPARYPYPQVGPPSVWPPPCYGPC